MAWDIRQARDFVKLTRKSYGETWKHVSLDLKEAMLAQHLLGVLIGQHAESIRVDAIEELWTMMRFEAGLPVGERPPEDT